MNNEEIMENIRNYFFELSKINIKEKFIRDIYHEFIEICKHIDELALTVNEIEFVYELEKNFLDIKNEWLNIQIDITLKPEVKYQEEIFEKIDHYLSLLNEIKSDYSTQGNLILQNEAIVIAQKANEKAQWALIIAIVGFFLSIVVSVFLSRYIF